MVQAVGGNRRRLVLHFDINNTIVMKDLAKGLNTTENVSQSIHWEIICLKYNLPRSIALSASQHGENSHSEPFHKKKGSKLRPSGIWSMINWLSLSQKILLCLQTCLRVKLRMRSSLIKTTLISYIRKMSTDNGQKNLKRLAWSYSHHLQNQAAQELSLRISKKNCWRRSLCQRAQKKNLESLVRMADWTWKKQRRKKWRRKMAKEKNLRS